MAEVLKKLAVIIAMIQGVFGTSERITTLDHTRMIDDDTSQVLAKNPPHYALTPIVRMRSVESYDCDGEGASIPVQLEIKTDYNPSETSWIISNNVTEEVVVERSGYANPNSLYTETLSVCSERCYQFTLFDSWGDGLSDSSNGKGGFYKLFYEKKLIKEGGGDFGASESKLFGDGCPSMHPSTSIAPSISNQPSSTMLPSDEPSTSVAPSSNPTPPAPSNQPSTSLAPSSSSPPSSSPSSSPSATRTDWWAADALEILEGHNNYVKSVCFNQDGKWIVSAGADNRIKLWSAQNGGAAVQTITGHTWHVNSLDINFDDTKLVSGSWDRTVRLWNFDSNGTISLNETFPEFAWVEVVKFSRDGRFLASGSHGNTIKIRDMNNGGVLVYTLTGHESYVKSLSFSPDGKILASGSYDETIKLWDVENGYLIGSYEGHTDAVIATEFSSDGTQLASGSWDDTIRIWNVENATLSLEQTLRHDGMVNDIKYSPDGQYLASSSHDERIKLWNQHDNYRLIQTLTNKRVASSNGIESISFSPDGKKIASAVENSIHIWGIACSPGNYGEHQECQPCPPGTFQPEPDQRNKESCIPCVAGTFNPAAGAKQCETCTQGTFQAFKGQTKCDECRVGGYCPNKVATDSCDGGFTACPIGTFNNMTGRINETSCIPCPPGTFSDNKTALDVCFECPKGTYQGKKGESECIVCNSTSYQSQTGQSKCKNCPPGTYPDPSRLSCLNCPKGTYSTGGVSKCSDCEPGSVQSQIGQSTCDICPSGTYSDQSKVTCLQCPYRLGSEENSEKCPFCAEDFYLNIPNINPENLIENSAKFCLPCPSNARCDNNTTIVTLKGTPGFWRDSSLTETFYKCNDISEGCLGGTSCVKGHSGVLCEVCVDENKYFDSSEGQCTDCPSFSKLIEVAGIFIGIVLLLFMMKYIAHKYKAMERFITNFLSMMTAIGIQAKFKIFISFCQVVVTIQPIYGVRMHSAFTSWFKFFDFFNFGLAEIFGIPNRCFGSMKTRLLIGAGWPYALALLLISAIFIYTNILNMRKLGRKDVVTRFLSRSLNAVIVIFYLVLPSVCRQIFDARTCKSFDSNDSENKLNSYLIADWSVKCQNGDSNYEAVTQVFWALFATWTVAVPVGVFVLIILIRPSVRSHTTTTLTEACQFLWFDYNRDFMFWEVIELVRKISLTGLIIFIDTEEGSERVLRLLVATGISIFYGTILSRARPYRRKDDYELAILSNLFLTCFFLMGIIIHQCEEGGDMDGENNICMQLFGFSDSYKATALAVILTAAMIVAFVLFTFIQSVNELRAPIVRLVSTNGTPYLVMPEGCKYHIFVSHIWASGQDKVHKIVRMLKLYLDGVTIWLDVDVLKNLSDLEESVKESAHFILFYSEGYFKSFNCRREVVKAMELCKPVTVMFEPNDDISVDKLEEMKEEFAAFWPQDATFQKALNYIFDHDPILWISKGLQFSLVSIKLVTSRLLTSLPYYKENTGLLDNGLKIDGESKPVEMLTPLDILYCPTNVGAHGVAMKLIEECRGDIDICAMNLFNDQLQRDGRQAVMLVYLNKKVFQDPGCLLCDSIIRSIEENIKVVLVHENDPNKGACAFWKIMEQTPEQLKTKPHSIFSNDIAISLYSINEYQKTSLRLLLVKMGAVPSGEISLPRTISQSVQKSLSHTMKMASSSMKLSFAKK